MNTKDNQRTRLSKMLFKNALMDLMKEKDSVSKISVRELCETAGLNRSTFYAHYNEPKDLLNELEDEILDSTKEHLEKIGAEN
ncbi:MAG: TetR/AcrR family transcriptional regulator, partial [Clostridia bacterium]|nr:TetR/AcrR family transcriptional regulator [Clostridia bacterium]